MPERGPRSCGPPTQLYIFGGAAAVLVSFCVLAPFHRKPRTTVAPAFALTLPPALLRGASLTSLIILCFLVAAGFFGKSDPLANPLPLTVWTLWWMGFTFLVVVSGNLWTVVNPWIGLYDLFAVRPRLAFPERWGYMPAILLFLAFAWFELIYVVPQDPERLAIAVAIYWLVNFAALLTFGPRWLARGEAFSVFFTMAGSFSPLHWQRTAPGDKSDVRLTVGRSNARDDGFASLTGVLFILVTLSSVSFDGLMRTFTWIGWWGINPLEYPGRSAVVWQNSSGLILSAATLGTLYATAIVLGPCRTGVVNSPRQALGLFALSLAPISIAYHLAHYLPGLIVAFPSAILALADPFGQGWSLLPEGVAHAGSSMGLGADMVVFIYRAQTAIIVLGHVIATFLMHRIALAQAENRQAAAMSELPLALLMVGYTLFGLWLLSTPQIELVSRIRSSHHLAASSERTSDSKGH